MRRLVVVLALVLAAGCRGGSDGAAPEVEVARTTTTTTPTAPTSVESAGLLLVWVPGGLPAGAADTLRRVEGVDAVTVVAADVVGLAAASAPPGFQVPVEVAVVDCDTWPAFVAVEAAEAVCGLDSGDAALGATSAEVRQAGPGAELRFVGGHRALVREVVADEPVGWAEVVVPAVDAEAVGVRTPRYALVRHDTDPGELEQRIRAALGTRKLRVRAPGEVPWLRHADDVLPPALLKAALGEFATRVLPGGRLELDAGWREANLVTVSLPVVGSVTCHRAVVDALRGALTEIAERQLVGQVDRRASGCWNGRVIAGTDQPSRHSWGAALDIVPAPSEPAVVEVFDRWGFTWGGRWLTPDPIHFEYVRPPRSPSGSGPR